MDTLGWQMVVGEWMALSGYSSHKQNRFSSFCQCHSCAQAKKQNDQHLDSTLVDGMETVKNSLFVGGRDDDSPPKHGDTIKDAEVLNVPIAL